jgi:hypothetical protein
MMTTAAMAARRRIRFGGLIAGGGAVMFGKREREGTLGEAKGQRYREKTPAK